MSHLQHWFNKPSFPVGKHNNRQHASSHHEVATDVKQMPIQPIIIIIIIDVRPLMSNYTPQYVIK